MTILIVSAVASVAGYETYAVFSGTTTNPGNSFAAGTVFLSDNDTGAAMFNVSNAKPTYSETHCIRVQYEGSLDADVKLYTPSSIGTLGPYVNLAITQGTESSSSFSTCQGDFTAFGTNPIYSGTLSGFASAHSSWSNGLAVLPTASATKWTGSANQAVVYKFVLTLNDDNNANGGSGGSLGTGPFAITWEGQNQ